MGAPLRANSEETTKVEGAFSKRLVLLHFQRVFWKTLTFILTKIRSRQALAYTT